MNGDIIPPRRSASSPPDPAEPTSVASPEPQSNLVLPEPALTPEGQPAPSPVEKRPKRRKKLLVRIALGVMALLLLVVALGVAWYYQALRPVDAQATSHTRISIQSGASPRQIGQLLHDRQLIQSTLAFDIYTRLSGTRDRLQAGAYNLSASESTQEIVNHLISGRTDRMTITFYPGATLRDMTDTPAKKRTDVTMALLRAGYEQAEIDAALGKTYGHPLFEGKPAGADLEGYIYGETYNFSSDATVEDVLTHVFDVFYAEIQKQNIIERLKQRNMTLYEGITLASIIEREESSSDTSKASVEQRQVAQVFYLRLEQGMPLGSDPTAYYGADKIGAERAVTVDTPYNTRIHAGLTPGPIASPSMGSLMAVVDPAPGDYLYFVSGDDDMTYFARTDAEHQANIRDHCTIKCAMP